MSYECVYIKEQPCNDCGRCYEIIDMDEINNSVDDLKDIDTEE